MIPNILAVSYLSKTSVQFQNHIKVSSNLIKILLLKFKNIN